jgi:hypothetical protein
MPRPKELVVNKSNFDRLLRKVLNTLPLPKADIKGHQSENPKKRENPAA